MANWLQKIINPPAVTSKSGHLPTQPGKHEPVLPQSLPNATIIYGVGAALMFVASFFLLLSWRWFPALIVFALGACLTGFALHLMKHQD